MVAPEDAHLPDAAQQALKLFQAPPPEGVRVATAAGATYLEYTYAPQERIINGFIQSLNGLYDYAKLTGDPSGASSSKKATPRPAWRCPTTTPAPGRCTTSTPNRTSTTTSC